MSSRILTPASGGSVTQLIFHVQPDGAVAGAQFTQQPVVYAADAGGNPVFGYNNFVVISINTGTGTLSGTKMVLAVNGVVTYTDLSIDTAGPFTLNATNGDVSVVSASFTVAAAGFNPANYGVANYWQDPTQEAYVNNDAVPLITDFTGSGNSAVAGSNATFKTNVKNGLPAFLLSSSSLANVNSILSGDSAVTIFLVFNPNDATSQYSPFCIGNTGVARAAIGVFLSVRGVGIISVEFAGNNPAIFESYSAAWSVLCIRKAPGAIDTTTEVFLNGSQQTVQGGSSSGTPSFGVGLTIGNFGGTESYAGYEGDLVIYPSFLSDSNKDAATVALKSKWGI